MSPPARPFSPTLATRTPADPEEPRERDRRQAPGPPASACSGARSCGSTPTRASSSTTYRGGRARPDGSPTPSHAFAGAGERADAAPVPTVVEVTSYDKPRAYAETGVPVPLLIDRDTCEVRVHSRPDGGRYETVRTLPFGKEVVLPEPVGITLNTPP
ncbi:Uma2 family endonuclease [Streptomyces sp. AC627_RSS907]|uniref:Uma2 family endonuclease n=1 Tax=Streptomyces sp. AC627_RSS907 TaxID=2823684 RepID=UPI0027E3D26E|nr:Uma2 family endonuclease [Streptomyces sp. AC627_RSS907]